MSDLGASFDDYHAEHSFRMLRARFFDFAVLNFWYSVCNSGVKFE